MDEEELTPEQQFAAEDPESMVPKGLLRGRSEDDIVEDLLRLGWSNKAARFLVTRAAEDLRRYRESPEGRREVIAAARKQFMGGVMLASLGLGINLLNGLGALSGALPVYIFSLGIVVIGLIMLTRGRMRWKLYRGKELQEPPGEGTNSETNTF